MFKVITDVATEPVTLAEARLQIKAVSGITTEDTLISEWITTAREIAEQYTGRSLAPKTLEMVLDAFPGGNIVLDAGPVTSVTSVKYTDYDGVEQTVSASDYALSAYGLSDVVALAYGETWPAARAQRDAVRIRYVTGYSSAPKAVKSAIRLMVGWMNEHRGDEMDPHDIQPPAAKALLDSVKVRSYS
jgi:uncharacterized phiE125 gp8 family phage protein